MVNKLDFLPCVAKAFSGLPTPATRVRFKFDDLTDSCYLEEQLQKNPRESRFIYLGQHASLVALHTPTNLVRQLLASRLLCRQHYQDHRRPALLRCKIKRTGGEIRVERALDEADHKTELVST